MQVHDPSRPRTLRARFGEQIRRNRKLGYRVEVLAGPRDDRLSSGRASTPSTPRPCAGRRRRSAISSSPEYFGTLLVFERSWLLLCRSPEGATGGGRRSRRSPTVFLHYYLGRHRRAHLDDSPFKNVVEAMIELAHELGITLNLGGGVRPATAWRTSSGALPTGSSPSARTRSSATQRRTRACARGATTPTSFPSIARALPRILDPVISLFLPLAHGLLVGRQDLPIPDLAVRVGGVGGPDRLLRRPLGRLARLEVLLGPLAPGPGAPLPPGHRRSPPQIVTGAIGVFLLAAVVYTGLEGTDEPNLNFAVTFVFVTFWLGMVVLSILLGDVFRAFNPWRAIARTAGAVFRLIAGQSHVRRFAIPSGSGAGRRSRGSSASCGSSSFTGPAVFRRSACSRRPSRPRRSSTRPTRWSR